MPASTSNKLPKIDSHDFPVLFTIDSSSRHESKELNQTQPNSKKLSTTPTSPPNQHPHPSNPHPPPTLTLPTLTSQIEHILATSPNAGEFLGKYRSKNVTESVKETVVKWASEGRDGRIFVRETLVTEENLEAVLGMMAVGGGKDVFDVKIKVHEKKKSEEERKVAEEKKKVDDRRKVVERKRVEVEEKKKAGEKTRVEGKEKLAEKKQEPVVEEKKPAKKKKPAGEKEVAERGKK